MCYQLLLVNYSQTTSTYLSLEILQSMTVFLFVLTMMKGNWIVEFGCGGPCVLHSSRFRSTRLLNDICCKTRSCNCCVFCLIRSTRFFRSFSSWTHSWSEFVGRPSHRISFFSFDIIFMAIRTFSASYTLLRMFFWSYYKSKVNIHTYITSTKSNKLTTVRWCLW